MGVPEFESFPDGDLRRSGTRRLDGQADVTGHRAVLEEPDTKQMPLGELLERASDAPERVHGVG